MRGLSLVAASGGHSSSRCADLSPSRPLLLWSTGSRRAGSAVVAHGPSCSAACGIFPDQGSNPRPLHWQADSQPLRHQGSPQSSLFDEASQERTVEACGAETCRYLRERSKHISLKGFITLDKCPLEVKASCQVKQSGEFPRQQFVLSTK